MIRISQISLPPQHNPEQLVVEAAKVLRISPGKIKRFRVSRRSIDARKKPDVKIVYSVDIEVEGSEGKILRSCRSNRAQPVKQKSYAVPKVLSKSRPVVVGFGPGGMFAGLVLAMAGLKPLILERGEDAVTRKEKVEKFFVTGQLEENSNVQFGEGGAGTFSDGKLNTGVNNFRNQWILQQFVLAGAQEEILYDAKPHVGTDVLVQVVQNIRKRIEALGGEIRFRTKVTDLQIEEGRLSGLVLEGGEVISCAHAIFAIGHSARDTFSMLLDRKIPMESKPFAMGVRIEQLQSVIDIAQYGTEKLPLPPADYKLVEHLEDETVYTFCMCPGGYVVAAASEEGGIVTNGMSNADRGGENANAALLVSLNPKDFPYEGVFGGMVWQQEIERKAYALTHSYRAPCQLVEDFLAGRASHGGTEVSPTYRPAVAWCDLHQVLPRKITRALEIALPRLDKKLPGFASGGAVLTGPETRSSSPVRILRNESKESALKGFYPCGEGAGYAGGIMSAAIDGMECAEAIIKKIQE